MDIKSLCAAAVVVVGVGQAEAATYNVAVTMTEYSLSCGGPAYTCEQTPKPDRPSWNGLVLDKTANGVLSITEISEMGARLALDLDDGGHVFDQFMYLSSVAGVSYWSYSGGTSYQVTWDGPAGGFQYATDEFFPWFEEVGVTMALREELAPVPLPASIAFLPAGIGALAMMRRRRLKGYSSLGR